MLNRILVNVNNEKEIEYLTKYAKVIKEKYPNVEIAGLFIKPDIEKSAYTGIINSYDSHELKEEEDDYEKQIKIEKKQEEILGEKFLSLIEGGKFYIGSGNAAEVILDEMRLFDLLLLPQPNGASITVENILKDHNNLDNVKELLLFGEKKIKEILEKHHKPVIVVPELENYSIDKILVADDQKLEVNKALFNFMDLFTNIKEFTALSVDIKESMIKDLNVYFEKTEKKVNYKFETGKVDEVILNYSVNYDLIIMGNLKHSFMVEKIMGKPGIRIIESTNKPVFIL
ncbi:hypothetical protein [uncultured Ilyobacter sp.]|uniref:hypothetical protein n=1 Tax=uncultured Ilyobacter sp. TaxID=544433 RepID=UPI0029F57FEB|nr:hypothetical protein [uncultured Ilyobacter sp.]